MFFFLSLTHKEILFYIVPPPTNPNFTPPLIWTLVVGTYFPPFPDLFSIKRRDDLTVYFGFHICFFNFNHFLEIEVLPFLCTYMNQQALLLFPFLFRVFDWSRPHSISLKGLFLSKHFKNSGMENFKFLKSYLFVVEF